MAIGESGNTPTERLRQRIIAYGHQNQTDSCPVDGNTLFEIGSITKVFTTLTLANLVEQGTLKLGDRVSTLLSDAVKDPLAMGRKSHWI